MSIKTQKLRVETINERLYLEVSRELDVSAKLVKDVVMNGQSKFTAFTMSSNTFDGVRWPYFGVFKAKHKVVQVYSYMKGMTPDQRQFFKDMIYLKYLTQKARNKPAPFNFNLPSADENIPN